MRTSARRPHRAACAGPTWLPPPGCYDTRDVRPLVAGERQCPAAVTGRAKRRSIAELVPALCGGSAERTRHGRPVPALLRGVGGTRSRSIGLRSGPGGRPHQQRSRRPVRLSPSRGRTRSEPLQRRRRGRCGSEGRRSRGGGTDRGGPEAGPALEAALPQPPGPDLGPGARLRRTLRRSVDRAALRAAIRPWRHRGHVERLEPAQLRPAPARRPLPGAIPHEPHGPRRPAPTEQRARERTALAAARGLHSGPHGALAAVSRRRDRRARRHRRIDAGLGEDDARSRQRPQEQAAVAGCLPLARGLRAGAAAGGGRAELQGGPGAARNGVFRPVREPGALRVEDRDTARDSLPGLSRRGRAPGRAGSHAARDRARGRGSRQRHRAGGGGREPGLAADAIGRDAAEPGAAGSGREGSAAGMDRRRRALVCRRARHGRPRTGQAGSGALDPEADRCGIRGRGAQRDGRRHHGGSDRTPAPGLPGRRIREHRLQPDSGHGACRGVRPAGRHRRRARRHRAGRRGRHGPGREPHPGDRPASPARAAHGIRDRPLPRARRLGRGCGRHVRGERAAGRGSHAPVAALPLPRGAAGRRRHALAGRRARARRPDELHRLGRASGRGPVRRSRRRHAASSRGAAAPGAAHARRPARRGALGGLRRAVARSRATRESPPGPRALPALERATGGGHARRDCGLLPRRGLDREATAGGLARRPVHLPHARPRGSLRPRAPGAGPASLRAGRRPEPRRDSDAGRGADEGRLRSVHGHAGPVRAGGPAVRQGRRPAPRPGHHAGAGEPWPVAPRHRHGPRFQPVLRRLPREVRAAGIRTGALRRTRCLPRGRRARQRPARGRRDPVSRVGGTRRVRDDIRHDGTAREERPRAAQPHPQDDAVRDRAARWSPATSRRSTTSTGAARRPAEPTRA